MSIELKLPAIGSVLLTGYEQSLQSTVGRCVTGQHALAGGSIVFLVDDDSDGNEATGDLALWLKANEAHAAAIERVHYVRDVRHHRDAEGLADAIKSKPSRLKHKPVLLVRDLGRQMLELPIGAAWLSTAQGLAHIMACPVLTIAHCGPAPKPLPKLTDYRADQVWRCTALHGLRVHLQRVKPASESSMILTGRTPFAGVITFEPIPEEGFAHV